MMTGLWGSIFASFSSGIHFVIGSSSWSLPASRSWRMACAVNVLEIEAMRYAVLVVDDPDRGRGLLAVADRPVDPGVEDLEGGRDLGALGERAPRVGGVRIGRSDEDDHDESDGDSGETPASAKHAIGLLAVKSAVLESSGTWR